jgi:hypothetical protein
VTSRRPLVYADEDIDLPLVRALRTQGFDVLTAHDANQLGQDDDEQLAFASSIGRVILSYNRKDLRSWHRRFLAAGLSHAGIVLLPQNSPLHRRIIRARMLLDWVAALGDDVPPLINWNDLQRQIHAGFRLDGYDEDETRVAIGQL